MTRSNTRELPPKPDPERRERARTGDPVVDASRRAGFVSYQLQLARAALVLQSPRAARAALRVLRPGDFPGEHERAATWLSVVRDPSAGESAIGQALEQLLRLPVGG